MPTSRPSLPNGTRPWSSGCRNKIKRRCLMRKAFHGYILIAPVTDLGCLVFTLIPFGIVLRYSLRKATAPPACSSAWSIIRRCS